MTRAGQAKSRFQKRREESNRPPDGESWIWITVEMLESPAWQAMPLRARRVVERVAIEHGHNAGTMNGKLKVTYSDFVAHGVHRDSIRGAMLIAKNLGFLEVTTRGRLSWGGSRVPSTYGLTWLPRSDQTPASNRWKRIKTAEEAKEAMAKAKKEAAETKAVAADRYQRREAAAA